MNALSMLITTRRIKRTVCLLFASAIIPVSAFSQCANFGTNPSQDYDCDGVINQNDLDDDNDGILDVNECSGTTTFNAASIALSNGDSTTLTSFPASITNVNGITGLNINITPSGNFADPGNTTAPPRIIPAGFSFAINPADGDGVLSTWTIDFVGTVKPRTININTPNTIYASANGAYEQMTATVTRLGTGTDSGAANPPCVTNGAPDSLVIVSNPNFSQVNSPYEDGVAYGNCGYSATFTDNNGMSKLIMTYGMPVVTTSPSYQVQPFTMYLTVCDDDIDADGIPSYFDLDSDADQCPDASEGDGTFPSNNLQTSTSMAGGSTNVKGFLGTGPVDANGVPTAVNGGQSVGSSENSAVVDAVDCSSILAIDYLSLSGRLDGSNVLLTWNTGSETNTTYFTVEESQDGKEFKPRNNKIKAIGNSTVPQKYSTSFGVYAKTLYRIGLHHTNGDVDYSNIISITPFEVKSYVNISPNPTGNVFNIDIKKEGSYAISIVDVTGKMVDHMDAKIGASGTPIIVNSKAWAKGIYVVTVTNKDTKEKVINKLVKQ